MSVKCLFKVAGVTALVPSIPSLTSPSVAIWITPGVFVVAGGLKKLASPKVILSGLKPFIAISIAKWAWETPV